MLVQIVWCRSTAVHQQGNFQLELYAVAVLCVVDAFAKTPNRINSQSARGQSFAEGQPFFAYGVLAAAARGALFMQ
jgi:hypothetical protein